MSIFDKLKKKGYTMKKFEENKKPVWEGPESSGPNGGVTFSLLSRFICCRERFRLYAVEGLKPADTFDHKKGFGDMWHVCEETFAKCGPDAVNSKLASEATFLALHNYSRCLCEKYKLQQEQVNHWYNVCKVTFPFYVEHWKHHKDVDGKKNLLAEQVFDVPYTLPSGRTVRLRGKWDSVDLVTNGVNKGVWLQENKTKGDVDEQKLRRQLSMDLQTMLYVVTLLTKQEDGSLSKIVSPDGRLQKLPFTGVRYNVVRRPLSGGKGTIVRHKGKPSTKLKSGKWSKAKPEESPESFYKRVAQYIKDDPAHYFMRLNVTVRPKHIERFKLMVLNPLLEQLCDWWEWINVMHDQPFKAPEKFMDETYYGIHWLHPYGVWNATLENASTDLDDYIEEENEVGLRRVTTLFPELS